MIVASVSFFVEMTNSKRREEFYIYRIFHFFKMFAKVRNGLTAYVTLFKTTNKRKVYCSYFTKKFKLVNPFPNVFFHIGIGKFLCINCPSKVPVAFFGDLNFGSRKYLSLFVVMYMTLQQAMLLLIPGSNQISDQ